ncbi:hypothetical protein DLAC_00069 [Tieghemostelium lacteum]|uniref:AB hydrolase-1 domain-containing protein n=1 Tax=Tieghemostelium lacteum TaxID=361077 RepID=A0A152A916_TIELA|nr:hypothetical protein DLAC_00069 [Tieghemostelium lacteum]|eukprot:KYR02621.1 hypothetical protein DLAC_00069 [Tieghemostelium lacteum]
MEPNNIIDDDQVSVSEMFNPPFSEPSLEIYRDSHYIRTSYGVTSYQLFEPELQSNGTLRPRLIKNLSERKYHKKPLKMVVLFHGIVIWSFIFHRYVQTLIENDFTVLLFDFYGRGKSEAPMDQMYTLDLFLSQALDLLDNLKVDSVYCIGYSMGGAVASHFASTHPQRLIKLILLGPAIAPVINMPFAAKLITWPIIGKFVFSLFGSQGLVNKLERERLSTDISDPDSIDRRVVDDLVTKIKWQIVEKPNYLNSFHSTLCNIPFQSGIAHLLSNIPKSLPIYVILGTKDNIINYQNSVNFLKQHLSFARVDSLECGHAFTLESPEQSVNLIIQYLLEPL